MEPTLTTWIYESPDGGKTIYRRKFLEYDRELVEEPIPVPQPHDNQYSELKCSIPKIVSKNST